MNPPRSEIPPPLPASVLAEDTERYDVAVVGFGIAGGSAALEAARAGARVLLLERAAVHGGTTCMAGGHFYLGGGTAVQQATGHEDSAEEMYKYLVATSKEPEHDKIRAYCEGSVEHFGWLESLGFEFERSFFPGKAVIQPGTEGLMFTGNETVWPFRELARPAPRGHKVPVPGDTGGAKLVMDLLRDRAEEAGVEMRYETGATALVTGESGAVVGLAWRSFGDTGVVRARRDRDHRRRFRDEPRDGRAVHPGTVYPGAGRQAHRARLDVRRRAWHPARDIGGRGPQAHGRAVHHRPLLPSPRADHRAHRQLPWRALRGRGFVPRADIAVRAGTGRLRGLPHCRRRAPGTARDAAGAAPRRLRDRGRHGGRTRPASRVAGEDAGPVQPPRRPRRGS